MIVLLDVVVVSFVDDLFVVGCCDELEVVVGDKSEVVVDLFVVVGCCD